MAVMIPKRPYDFTEASLEDVMFSALEGLPEDYYVFHSFQIAMQETYNDGTRTVREADFVIFNPQKGIICIEAKAGHVRFQDGEWLYSNGKVMKHNGPFKQAKSCMWELSDLIKKRRGEAFEQKCKFYHAVWFPSLTYRELKQLTLPSDAPMDIILTKEALSDPLPSIEHIYEYNLSHGKKMSLSESDVRVLITRLFCPAFDIVPSASYEKDLKKITFNRMLKEQTNILNFLVDQRTAVINGAAGTGKTMIALAKAQLHARQGEKVLFLCYNKKLQEYLDKEYKEENIYYYTIDGLACKICNTPKADYKKLSTLLEEMYFDNSFPYKHIVIDEGQDFGKDEMEEIKVIQTLRDIVMDREDDTGTFYLFYDKLQKIAAKKMPSYIEDADCKMTLYRNCRNTENIAITSLKTIPDRKPKMMMGGVLGEPATIHYCNENNIIKCLDETIESIRTKNYSDIVILTAKTIEKTAICHLLKGGAGQEKYKGIPVATCRTFKGLEADAIILIDVDISTFEGENAMLFYVGTSRARLKLDIITDMDEEQCRYVLLNDLGYEDRIRNARKTLTSTLNALSDVTDLA